MEYKYIDAHSHLNFDQFDADRTDVITAMKQQGIGAINVGIDVETSAASIELATEHEHIRASVGCHPTSVADDFSIDLYRGLIEKNQKECAASGASQQVVAVGECGLDYSRSQYRDQAVKERQREAFIAQIELALETELPLILHLRPQAGSMDAYKDGLDILEYYAQKYGDDLRGTAHFFVGDDEIARRFLDMNFYLSATGVVTFDEDLQRVFAELPSANLLAETDAPFAAPVPHRGQRNSPLYVPDIVAGLAEIKQVSTDDLAPQLVANTERLFSL